jgi:hypothetical protein
VIGPERLDQVTAIVACAGLHEETIAAMREAFSDMHLTYCMDYDVGSVRPIRCEKGFNIYLVDGRSHCMRFTTDLEAATGIVVAEIVEGPHV